MEDTSGDAKARIQQYWEIRKGFEEMEIGDEGPSQYPKVRERKYPDSPLWRCDNALSRLADTWESYEDTIRFFEWEGINIYDIFSRDRFNSIDQLDGIYFEKEGGQYIGVVMWDEHCMRIKQGEFTLDGEGNRVVFDSNNLFPQMINYSTILNFTVNGVELDRKVNGENEIIPLDTLRDMILLMKQGLVKAQFFLTNPQ